jgi:hypothetical protein
MQIQWYLGDEQILETANTLLDEQKLGLPREKDDFYYAGAANWIKGFKERAAYDFQRSSYSVQDDYQYHFNTAVPT